MTEPQNFSDHVGRLSARVTAFGEHLATAAQESGAQLRARGAALRQAWKADASSLGAELGADMTRSQKWITDRAQGLRKAVKDDLDKARKHGKADHGHLGKATRNAEVAEAYARAAHADAVAAVAESEKAAIEALAARADAKVLTDTVLSDSVTS